MPGSYRQRNPSHRRRLAKQGRDDLLDRVASGELRKDFTPTERVAIAKAIEEEIGKIARERQIALAGTRPNTGDLPVDRPEGTGNETRAIAAEKAGFKSDRTYRRAKAIEEEIKAQGERRGNPAFTSIPVDRPEFDGNETRAIAAEKAGFGTVVAVVENHTR